MKETSQMKPMPPALLILALTASAACAGEPAAVWFSPAPETPDYTDPFSKPQLWPKARQHVDIIKLGPNQRFARAGLANDVTALHGVNAFRKMQEWDFDVYPASDWSVVVLRAIMDISAPAFSLGDT